MNSSFTLSQDKVEHEPDGNQPLRQSDSSVSMKQEIIQTKENSIANQVCILRLMYNFYCKYDIEIMHIHNYNCNCVFIKFLAATVFYKTRGCR